MAPLCVIRGLILSVLLASTITSAAWTPSMLQAFCQKNNPANKKEDTTTTVTTTPPLAAIFPPSVRGGGGGFLWWKSTEEKKDAAKEHAKKSWFWGKEYAKDKACESKGKAEANLDAAKRKAGHATDQSKESLWKAKHKLGEKYDEVKQHAKQVVGKTKDELRHGVNCTKDTVKTGKHKVKAVSNSVEVLGDVKHGYDKYQAGKAKVKETVKGTVRGVEDSLEKGAEKTKGFLRRLFEALWPPARPRVYRTTTTTRTRPVTTGGPLVEEEELVEEQEIPTPRSVDEALEEFEACKAQEEMTEEDIRKTRSLFQTAKDMFKGKPRLKSELGPRKSFAERYAEEKAEAEERQRHWED